VILPIFYRDFNTSLIITVHITGGRPSTSVNGDIAIQLEWSNFDSSQNQNPLTSDVVLETKVLVSRHLEDKK